MNKNIKIPNTWKLVTLDDISKKITDGSHNPPKGRDYGVPMLSAKNIQNNFIDFSGARYLTDEDFQIENQRTSLEPMDILLTTVGTIGRVALVPQDNSRFVLQRSVTVIKPLVNPKYLLYYIQSSDFQKILVENSNGTAQKGIYLNILKTLKVPLAPIEEQNRIVDKIEELFSELEYAKKNLNEALLKLEYKFLKTLNNIFKTNKGTKYKLSEIADWGSGGTPDRKNISFFNGNIPWVKTQELKNKYITGTDEHLTVEGVENSSTKIYPKGSIVIAMYGSTVGKLSILNIDACTNQACAVGIPYSNIVNIEYLYYYLLSHKNELISKAKGGAQQNISLSILKDFDIHLLLVHKQEEIVINIDILNSEILRQKESLINEIKRNELLCQKILKDAFEGKLSQQYVSDSSVDSLFLEISKLKEMYIKSQIEMKKNKPKYIKMAKEKLSILEVLKKHKEPISAENLWHESKYEKIDDFYEKIKEVEHLIIQDNSKRSVKISLK